MAQEVTRRPLTARGKRFEPWPRHVGFLVDVVALGQIFLFVLRFFACQCLPRMLETNHPKTALTKMTKG
jgi:hypothetical protein